MNNRHPDRGDPWRRLDLIALVLLALLVASVFAGVWRRPPLTVTVTRYALTADRSATDLHLLATNPGPLPVLLRLADVSAQDDDGTLFEADRIGAVWVAPGQSVPVELTAPLSCCQRIIVAPPLLEPTIVEDWGR